MKTTENQAQYRADRTRQSPVPWDRLKQIEEEHPAPRISGGVIAAVGLLGLSIFSFFLAFYFALEPTEWIEPAQYIFLAAVALGLLAGWAGFLCVLRAPPRGLGK